MIHWNPECDRPETRRPRQRAAVAMAVALVAASTLMLAQETTQDPDDVPLIQEPVEPTPLDEARDLVRVGRYAEAEEILGPLMEATQEDAAVLRLYGQVLVAVRKFDEAVPVLGKAIEADPAYPRLHFQLGTALTQTGDPAAALEAFAKELEVNEDPLVRHMAHVNRSFLLRQQSRWAEAAVELESALELEPDHAEAYGELATLYLNADKPTQAAQALDRGEPLGFSDARLRFNVGARLYNDHSYEEAAAAFRKALTSDPQMAEAERSLAATLSRLGRHDEALDHLEKYLVLQPDAPDAEQVRGMLAEAGRR